MNKNKFNKAQTNNAHRSTEEEKQTKKICINKLYETKQQQQQQQKTNANLRKTHTKLNCSMFLPTLQPWIKMNTR